MCRSLWLFSALLLGAARSVSAADALPLAEDVNYKSFREGCLRLLRGLKALKAPLPEDTQKAIHELPEKEPRESGAVIARVQKLLDGRCLIGITINPESRVKAVRGPAPAELLLNRESVVLVKVYNEAGVTHALQVAGPQLWSRARAGKGRWLEAAVVTAKPFAKALSGRAVEYVALRLVAHEAGKREATLKFDVGQGTQDLGFRAEVPVLFKIMKGKTDSPGRPKR
jgi:hypothetical protein